MYASAELALNYLTTSIADGGVMSTLADLDISLDSYIMFEEVVDPSNLVQPHILNGYIFSLIGLYDWWQLQPDDQQGSHYFAKVYFEKGVRTLEKILPYYDANGWSLYDMWHVADISKPYRLATPAYHYTHIYLLQAMYGLTNSQEIGRLLKNWSEAVGYFQTYDAPIVP